MTDAEIQDLRTRMCRVERILYILTGAIAVSGVVNIAGVVT